MGTYGFVRQEILDLSDGNLQICHHMDTFELVSWNFFPHLMGSRAFEELLDWFVIVKSLPSALVSRVLMYSKGKTKSYRVDY